VATPKSRARTLAKYGLTLDDFQRLLVYQGGVCYICGRPPREGKNLHVDHDHKTGLTRGLLDWQCNRGLRAYRDDPAKFAKAAEYLSRPPAVAVLGARIGTVGPTTKKRRKKKAPRH
jgi:hypothetical protein